MSEYYEARQQQLEDIIRKRYVAQEAKERKSNWYNGIIGFGVSAGMVAGSVFLLYSSDQDLSATIGPSISANLKAIPGAILGILSIPVGLVSVDSFLNLRRKLTHEERLNERISELKTKLTENTFHAPAIYDYVNAVGADMNGRDLLKIVTYMADKQGPAYFPLFGHIAFKSNQFMDIDTVKKEFGEVEKYVINIEAPRLASLSFPAG